MRDPEWTRRRVFAVLWLGQFVAIAGLTAIVPLLPFYLGTLGVPAADVPWWTALAVAAPAAGQLVTSPLWGAIGDRYGRRVMVVRAQLGLTFAVILMAAAATPTEFVLCRLLQGACGGIVPAIASLASALTPADRQGRTFGGLVGATAAGSLLGPVLGALLAGRFGYDALFGGTAVLLGAATMTSLVLLRGVGGPGWTDRAAAFPLRQAVTLLGSRSTARNVLLAGLAAQAGAYALVVVFAPRVGQLTGSVSSATVWVGVLQALTWAASLLGGPWWGARHDRRSPRGGFVVAATGCAVAVALQGIPGDPGLLVPLRAAQGFCFAALTPAVLHVVSRVAPDVGRGSCLGVATAVVDLGQLAGPPLGAIVERAGPPVLVFLVVGALFLVAAALAAVRPTRRRHEPVPEPVRTRAESGALT